jgi:hypothetical protein
MSFLARYPSDRGLGIAALEPYEPALKQVFLVLCQAFGEGTPRNGSDTAGGFAQITANLRRRNVLFS